MSLVSWRAILAEHIQATCFKHRTDSVYDNLRAAAKKHSLTVSHFTVVSGYPLSALLSSDVHILSAAVQKSSNVSEAVQEALQPYVDNVLLLREQQVRMERLQRTSTVGYATCQEFINAAYAIDPEFVGQVFGASIEANDEPPRKSVFAPKPDPEELRELIEAYFENKNADRLFT